MKNQFVRPGPHPQPSEDEIRAYAYHLYLQGNGEPGHAVDHWLEAIACLKANIPAHHSAARLQHLVTGLDDAGFSLLALEATILAS